MDFRYLKAFVLTAEFQSFSRAAEELKVAQSAVSRQVKLLEESTGEELIIRSSKKVILTHKGKELYLASQNYIHTIDSILQKESDKTIKVGILHGLLENWFQLIVTKYYKKFKNNIDINVDTPENLKAGIEGGRYDLIMSVEDLQNELVTSLHLFDEKLVLISKNPIAVGKINQSKWIVYNNTDFLFQAFKKAPKDIIQVNSITSVVNLVRNNVGVAVVPDHMLKNSDNLHQSNVPGLKKSKVYLTTLNYRSYPKHLNNLINIIKENLP